MPPSLSSHDQLILLRKRARRRLVGAIALVSVATVVLWNVVGHVPDQRLKPQSINIVELNSSAPTGEQGRAASQVAAVTAAASAAQTDLPAALPEEGAPPPAQVSPSVAAAVASAKPAEPKTPPVAKVEEKKPEPTKLAEAPKPKPKAEEKPKVEDKPKVKKPDPMAILEGRADSEEAPRPKAEKKAEPAKSGKVMIQLAALSDPDKVEALRNKLDSVGGLSAHYSFSKVQTSKGEVTRVRVGPFASADEAQAALAKLARAGVSGIVVSH